MSGSSIELRVRHPKGSHVISTVFERSSVSDLKREISKISGIPASRIAFKLGYPPQRIELPDNTTLENVGIQSGETIIVEENQNASQGTSASSGATFQNQSAAAKKENSSLSNFHQIPNPDGLIMIRRVIAADNSCLFNSIAYALENKAKNKAKDLREVVAGYVMSDPDTYNEAVLERSAENYCKWINKDDSWGGAIELEILSKHYKVEICAVDIGNLLISVFGDHQNYSERIYVLYDGIHYDILVRNISEDMDTEMDITVFNPNDKYAYEGALALAKELKAKKQFTNTTQFTIQCGVCYEKFKGENEAVEHNKKTGHINFQEVSASS